MPEEPDDRVLVIMDSRESEDRRALVGRRRTYRSTTKELPIGDYLVGANEGDFHAYAAIEFKTAADFSGDVGRELPRKLEELAGAYQEAYLVVAGSIEDALLKNPRLRFNHVERERTENRLYGALLSIIAHRKVGVILLPSEADFPEWMVRLARRVANKREMGDAVEERPILTMKGSDRTLQHEAEDVLAAMTGVGRAAARGLLETFKTVAAVAAASPKELAGAEGIGKIRAEHIRRVFHGEEVKA